MNSKRWVLLLVASVGVIALSACNEIQTPDGKIPAGAESQLGEYLGEFEGHFDGASGKITLSLEDLKPKVTFTTTDGRHQDLIDASCDSRVGSMLSYKAKKVSDDKYVLKSVVMGFDPGACSNIRGRALNIKFDRDRNENLKLKLSIYSHSEIGRYECLGIPPDDICYNTTEYHYLEGKFKKAGNSL